MKTLYVDFSRKDIAKKEVNVAFTTIKTLLLSTSHKSAKGTSREAAFMERSVPMLTEGLIYSEATDVVVNYHLIYTPLLAKL